MQKKKLKNEKKKINIIYSLECRIMKYIGEKCRMEMLCRPVMCFQTFSLRFFGVFIYTESGSFQEIRNSPLKLNLISFESFVCPKYILIISYLVTFVHICFCFMCWRVFRNKLTFINSRSTPRLTKMPKMK